MSLRTDSKYPVHRTYVVKLSSDASPEALSGLLENLVSGQHRQFMSAGELLQLFGVAPSPVQSCKNCREAERVRFARELHDAMGHHLTAMRLDVALMEIEFADKDEELVVRLAALKKDIDASTAAIRDIVANLRPMALNAGLVAAARSLLSGVEERTNIRCNLIVVGVEYELDKERISTAFRILQEALVNVIRHANADHLTVRISFDIHEFHLSIRDNGTGFDVGTPTRGGSFGLTGIRERVSLLGGAAMIASEAGKGTLVSVTIPIAEISSGKEMAL